MPQEHQYVPLLRWKRGERVGLQNLSSAGKVGVKPLFLLSPEQFGETKATSKSPALSAAESFAQEVMTAWGTSEFFLEASSLNGAGGAHPLIEIAAAARAIGLSLVPATQLDAPDQYQQAVHAIAAQDGRGIGLRVDLQQMTSASDWAPTLKAMLPKLDLIVDLDNNVGSVASLGAAVGAAFASLYRGADWRTVTLVGTSLPDNFSGFGAGPHLIHRAEFELWNTLSALGLSYRLDFGDYATVAVNAPPPGISWGFPINVKYTLVDDFLVCRGVRTTGFGAIDQGAQLIGHAKRIVAHRGRGALSHCWGDTMIDNIATGAAPPKGLEHWVQISVNRHIELTSVQLP